MGSAKSIIQFTSISQKQTSNLQITYWLEGRSMSLLSDDDGADPDANTDATLANSDEASS
jgi:hypothetical protein